MGLTSDSGGELVAVLRDLDVDDELLAEVRRLLGRDQDDLRSDVPVPTSGFGSFAAGARIHRHAGLAHQVVAEAMADLVATMSAHEEGVRQLAADVVATDEGVHARFQRRRGGGDPPSDVVLRDPGASA